MRHRSIKSRAGRMLLGAVAAGALSGAGASIARATLTLDLEAGSGTPNSPVTSVTGATAGSPITLNVYAVVTDPANSGSADGLGGLFASFDAAGNASTGLSMSLTSPFNYALGSAASNGNAYSYTDSNGVTHQGVGNYSASATAGSSTPAYDSTTPSNWVFAAYLTNSAGNVSSIVTGGTALTNGSGAFYQVGTLTLNTSASAANGSTVTVTGTGRTQVSDNMVAALWSENGTVETPALGTTFATDDSVSVTIGSVTPPPTPHAGDTAPQDGHVVNTQDLANVLNNLGTFNAAGYAYPDVPNDTTAVSTQDLAYVLNNLGEGNSPSIIQAPEPTSLGCLGLGALAFIRRRNRK